MTTTNGHRPNIPDLAKVSAMVLIVCECGFIGAICLGFGQSKEDALCPACGRMACPPEPDYVAEAPS
jgi:hypothetical protein